MSEEEKLERVLAIDYGKKRIGLALSDPLLTFAYAFKTILNDSKLWQELSKIIEEKSISKIILGYPLMESGEHSDMTKTVLDFKIQLEKKLGLEVLLQDERYTSEMAKELILKSVSKKSKRKNKGLIDMNSAAIILQDYLDEK